MQNDPQSDPDPFEPGHDIHQTSEWPESSLIPWMSWKSHGFFYSTPFHIMLETLCSQLLVFHGDDRLGLGNAAHANDLEQILETRTYKHTTYSPLGGLKLRET